MLILLAQLVVVVIVLIGYIVLTVLGFDGTPLLTVLIGQGIGAGLQAAGSNPNVRATVRQIRRRAA